MNLDTKKNTITLIYRASKGCLMDILEQFLLKNITMNIN